MHDPFQLMEAAYLDALRGEGLPHGAFVTGRGLKYLADQLDRADLRVYDDDRWYHITADGRILPVHQLHDRRHDVVKPTEFGFAVVPPEL